MITEIENRRVVDLILQNILYTPDLHSNFILILEVCKLGLDVGFGENNIIAKFNNGDTIICDI